MECHFRPTESGDAQYVCKFCNEETPPGRLYPHPPRRNCEVGPPGTPHGVGYHLKRLLAQFHLLGKAGCRCDDHAAEMDRNGPDWCAANIETIVGWMRAEARKRKLTFSAVGARLLVRWAIRNARLDLPA